MSGFDIAPAIETVGVRGLKLKVLGLDVEHIAHLFREFPEVSKAISAQAVDIGALMKLSSRLLNAIVLGGLRDNEMPGIEDGVKNLMLGEKAKIVAAIVRLTMPDGLGPFVELMTALGLVRNAEGAPSASKVIRLKTKSSGRPSSLSENVTTRAAMS